jgi:Acetyltransferase (GNAT) domain
MELAEQNFETISTIRLHNMSAEQIVEADRKLGMKFHFADGIWWREVKPFFYHPAIATARIVPGVASPSPWLALGGYYHMVPEGAESNGAITANEISDPAGYDLKSLKRKRGQIQRALAAFRIQPVTNLQDLLTHGYDVYLDWERRIGDVHTKRSNPDAYRRWITSVLAHPYGLILGAYAGDRLVAYMTIYASDGVANCSKIFSHSEFSQQTPSSALLYSFVKIAANNPEIRRVWHGLRHTNPSLQRYKAVMGFDLVSYPAYIRLRAGIRPLVRWCFPSQYQRLMGQYPAESAA